ncbi:hypothetical protein AMETH_1585 [Amycolatopsis methanolica 239]|uniref:Uncharacterized protein n=1 Tax=Amycolatopsis methanolica 239 TaxID=1068978 RepID=A0A076MV40_AMYME|nr:hypothetical protein AMETH_1585 [Amycolatopsis methanolica 239]
MKARRGERRALSLTGWAMTGFDAVPDELRQTASTIGDVVSGVAGLAFRAPAGGLD